MCAFLINLFAVSGSEHDEWRLKQLFIELGFSVDPYRNPMRQVHAHFITIRSH